MKQHCGSGNVWALEGLGAAFLTRPMLEQCEFAKYILPRQYKKVTAALVCRIPPLSEPVI